MKLKAIRGQEHQATFTWKTYNKRPLTCEIKRKVRRINKIGKTLYF